MPLNAPTLPVLESVSQPADVEIITLRCQLSPPISSDMMTAAWLVWMGELLG